MGFSLSVLPVRVMRRPPGCRHVSVASGIAVFVSLEIKTFQFLHYNQIIMCLQVSACTSVSSQSFVLPVFVSYNSFT